MNLTKKKTKLICFSVNVLLMMLIVLSCVISIIGFSPNENKVANALAASPGTASVLNLNENGVAQDYFSGVVKGKQNEYIYLGTNVSSATENTPGYLNSGTNGHTGAIKWQVLSITDTKYNSAGGTWLLWSDYRLGCGYYSPNAKSPYYVFWSNSMIRAKLNGGTYLSTVDNSSDAPDYNQSVTNTNSWLYQIFTQQEERASFVPATSYETWCGGLSTNYSSTQRRYTRTQGIIGSANTQYTVALVDDARDNRGATAIVVNNSEVSNAVMEECSGDYLFLIDYDDINNVNYGFGDNGAVYAKNMDSSWTSSRDDGYHTTLGSKPPKSDYLKEGNHIGGVYSFLRVPVMYEGSPATALGINGDTGELDLVYCDVDTGAVGIRPAFNFSPSSVIYATAANVSSNGSTFALVSTAADAKPAYKVYLKSNTYTNYSVGSHSNIPKLTAVGSTVSVEKSGQSGSAVFLLADPSGNGEVKYQATAAFNGSGIATATLPGGVKASDYVTTVLFLDGNARGDEYAEVVTASYTQLSVPQDKSSASTQYYSGSNYTFKLSYVDSDCLDVATPTYLGLNGNTTLPTSTSTNVSSGEYTLTAKEVGKYTVTITPKSGRYWIDGTATPKEYVFYIKHKVTAPKFTTNSSDTISSPYNKNGQTFTITGFDDDLMNINIDSLDTSELSFDKTKSEFSVTKAKTSYNVKAELKDKTLMEWASAAGDVADKPLTITITKLQIDKPDLTDPTQNSKPYTGSEVSFPLTNYTPNSGVTITAPTSPTGASVDDTALVLKATDANTYVFSVKLDDTDNTEWVGGGALPYTISVTISSGAIKKPSLESTKHEEEASKEYVAGGVTFTLYNVNSAVKIDPPSGVDSSIASISGNTITITKASATAYVFTVSLVNTSNTTWESGGTGSYTLKVTVTKAEVEKPEFMSGADVKTYNGNSQSFALTWNSSIIDIKDESATVVTAISEKNAKKYTYTMHLKDTDNYQWKDTADTDPKDLEFTMKPKAVTFTITCSESGATPTWETGKADVIYTVVVSGIEGSDTVKMKVYIEKSGTKSYDFANIDETVAKTIKATLPDYLTPGGYVFGIELPEGENDNDNYELPSLASDHRKSFIIKGAKFSLTADNMPWRCKYVDTSLNLDIPVDIMGEGYVTGKAKVTYNTYEYEFYVDTDVMAALGAEIDTSKGTNGISGDTKWTNAVVSKTITVYYKPSEGFDGTSGSFTLTYEIAKAKYDLSNAKWDYVSPFEYDPLVTQSVKIIDLPAGLTIVSPDDYSGNRKKPAGTYTAKVENIQNSNANYMDPVPTDNTTYIYKDGEAFPWELEWKINPKQLTLNWTEKNSDNNDFIYYVVSGVEAERIDSYLYYKASDYDNNTGIASGSPIALSSIVVPNKDVHAYWAVAVLQDSSNYEIVSNKAKRFTVGSYKEIVKVELKDAKPFVYNGKQYGKEIKVTSDDNTLTSANIDKKYYKNSVSDDNLLSDAPKDAGKYILVVSLKGVSEEDYEIIVKEIPFEIEKAKITATWDTSGAIPKIANESKYKDIIGYIYYDEDGNELEDNAELEVGKTYTVKAIIKGSYGENYEFVAEDGETVLEDPTMTDEEEFTLKEKPNNGSGNNANVGSGNQGGTAGGTLDEILKKVREIPLWQLIASAVSIILIAIFLSKTASYDSKRKKYNKKADKLDNVYAVAPFLGITATIWTAIACVLMGLAVVSFIMMMIAKSKCGKAEEEYEDRLEEYNRNKADFDERKRDENMRMMLMGMMGGNNGGQGGFAGGYSLGADDIRGIVSETMTALLPGMQQLLPQQASSNDELVEKLIEQNEQNEKRMEKLFEKFAEQKSTEKIVEREVASAGVSDAVLERLVSKLQPATNNDTILKVVEKTEHNDETIKQLLKNQEMLMEKIVELSGKQSEEKIVEKEVVKEVPVEKIVEKVIEVPVEKIVEKEIKVEVPVERIVEVPIEVEKIVEKEVIKEVKVAAAPKPKKEVAPKLTLDEAYALLTKEQKKYFDGLKAYALTKDKCKEKKSTYFIVFGPNTANPLLKLTIKKDTVVALYKMEDEYMKDIRRNATSDGAKIKVKETELIVSDAQAFKTAKEMIDLREDQIERYADYLKEQKAMNRK